MKKTLAIIAILGFSSSTYAAIKPKDDKKKDLPKVFTEILLKKEISKKIDYLGRLTPLNSSKIYSPIQGVVVELKTRFGGKVRKGQTLAIIKQNVVGLEVMPLKIKSPMNGFALSPKITENSFVSKNGLLFTIYDASSYKMTVNVSPKDGEKISTYSKVKIMVGEKIISGTVKFLSEDIDPMTGTRSAEIHLNTKGKRLRPGTMASANFEFDPRKSFVINKSLLKVKGSKSYLQILDKENKIKNIDITVLSRFKDSIEIGSHLLAENMKIIVKSTGRGLSEGVKVMEVSEDSKDDSKSESEDSTKKTK